MDFDRWIQQLCEPIDRAMSKGAPWLIGFTFCYVAGHVIVAKLNGWL